MLYRQAAPYETPTSLLVKCPVSTDTDRRTLMDKRGKAVRIIAVFGG